jgi:hypothetical protein
MQALTDDNTRDMYWCAVLKFLCDLLLTTPSEEAMTELLGFLEPMCDSEEVHEIGSTFEEEKTRQEIYKHHLSAQADLVTVTAAVVLVVPSSSCSSSSSTSHATVAGDPVVDAADPFDVLAHFLAD